MFYETSSNLFHTKRGDRFIFCSMYKYKHLTEQSLTIMRLQYNREIFYTLQNLIYNYIL